MARAGREALTCLLSRSAPSTAYQEVMLEISQSQPFPSSFLPVSSDPVDHLPWAMAFLKAEKEEEKGVAPGKRATQSLGPFVHASRHSPLCPVPGQVVLSLAKVDAGQPPNVGSWKRPWAYPSLLSASRVLWEADVSLPPELRGQANSGTHVMKRAHLLTNLQENHLGV